MAKKNVPSTGSDPKSKSLVAKKMEAVMGEFKRHDLKSGGSGEEVTNPRQAKAIALSEARRAGAKIPPSPNQPVAKKRAGKKWPAKKNKNS